MIKTPYFIVCLSQNISQMAQFLMQSSPRVLFVWKSILKSKRVISMGAKWRVRGGVSISVFKDNWLPYASGGRVIASVPAVDLNMKVADLIDARVGGWNNQVIDSCLLPFNASRIKAVPLSDLPQADVMYWALERNGIYSVKSGYCALCDEARREEASSSNSGLVAGFWTKIWKLGVLGKVKHFLWRACTNSLPTKLNLVKQKIMNEAVCHL